MKTSKIGIEIKSRLNNAFNAALGSLPFHTEQMTFSDQAKIGLDYEYDKETKDALLAFEVNKVRAFEFAKRLQNC